MANGRLISPAALLEARRLYEETDISVARIALLLGVDRRTVFRQAERRGWCPRRLDGRPHPSARMAPAEVPESEDANRPDDASTRDAPTRDALTRGELIARLVGRIEVEIAAVERLVAKAANERETDGVAETERAARTLAVLVRSLRELAALEKNEPDEDDDAAERDADAFRRELGATLERVLAGGQAS